jgi:restriction endonuclease
MFRGWQHSCVLARPEELRALIDEYGQLDRLKGTTPQSRGQRFNGLIADVLGCWGIDARADVNALGNIDVAFTIGDTRFILEAKWEDAPADTGRISKLQKRIRQRLGGTLGLFVSMSGFSNDALREVKDGERLEVLLLDREHFEAMLAGLFAPQELLKVLLERASFYGEPYSRLLPTIEGGGPNAEEILFEAPAPLTEVVRSASPSFRACAVVSNLPFGQSGLVETSSDVLLLTLDRGLVEVDLRSRRARNVLCVTGCSRNAHVAQDGSIYFVRHSGIARLRGENMIMVAGGLSGNVTLVPGGNGDIWAFCNSRTAHTPGASTGALLVQLGDQLGDQRAWQVSYPDSSGVNAAWIDGDTFLVVGSSGAAICNLSGSASRFDVDFSNPMGLMRVGKSQFVIAAGDVSLLELEAESGHVTELAALNLQGSVSELCPAVGGGGGYLYSHYANELGEPKGVVVRFAMASAGRT